MTGEIAYLGPPGSFAHQAVSSLPGYGTPMPVGSVSQALSMVRSGQCRYALVPFENSVEGAVAATLDGLADLRQPALHIRAEVVLTVHFVLVARRGTALSSIGKVATHPHAAAQCRQWLARELPAAEIVLESSTSSAARDTAGGAYDAAVCSPVAAELYDLQVLADNVADNDAAVTRFVVVSRPEPAAPSTGADRTTLVLFEHGDHPGALLEMLTEFAVRGVNLTRLESRPTGAGLGSYCFSLDCDGHIDDLRVAETLRALRRVCAEVRYLGSYPRGEGSPEPPRRGTADEDFAEAAQWLDRVRHGDPGS